ncbi:hypothetical protein EAE96_010745 [Botrytis aclada]|nr:hypothetical protein EAE96_010745 [Botrytis aclada]
MSSANGPDNFFFFTLEGPDFSGRWQDSAGHVDTLMTILKAICVPMGSRFMKDYVVIAVSGTGAGSTSARSSVSEVDVQGYSSRPGGQILQCLVFTMRWSLSCAKLEFISGDILDKFNLRYVPFPTRVSMGPRNFDISKAGLALVAQTEEQFEAQHDDISDVYFIPFDQLPTPKKSKELIPIRLETVGITGSASIPVFSPDKKSWLAFLKHNDNSTGRGENFIFKRIICQAEGANVALNPVNLAWGNHALASSERLFYWADSQMSIFEILIPLRDVNGPLTCKQVVIDFDDHGSILGIDCPKKSELRPDNPRLLVSRALANGSTDFIIYNPDTGERLMVQRASIGEVMTEQNQDGSNEIGGNLGDLTEDGIIEDGIIENREEVVNENSGTEDGIIENRERLSFKRG